MSAARPTPSAALRVVSAREPWLQVRAGRPDGAAWTSADRLLTRPALEGLVARAGQRLAGEHPQARQDVLRAVAAACLLDRWGWALAVAAAGALAATGQVLDLAPDRVHLCVDGGDIVGVAVEGLSGASGGPGLREELSGHLAALQHLLTTGPHPLLRRSRRLLHAGTGDAVVAALLRQAAGLDRAERAQVLALADRLLAEAGTWGEPAWVVADTGTDELRTRRRTACCLWYRLPAQEPCLSCPRVPEADRRARLCRQALAEATA